MKEVSEIERGTVAIIAPGCSPIQRAYDMFYEIKANTKGQKNLERFTKFITSALNEWLMQRAKIRSLASREAISVSHEQLFCASDQADSGSKFFARIFHDSTDELTSSLRDAVRFLAEGVVAQQDFSDELVTSEKLSEEDKKWLQVSIDSFLSVHGGKPISDALQIFDNISDRRSRQVISDDFKQSIICPAKFDDVVAVALVDGFHESENCIYLRIIDADFAALKSKRYACSDPAFYDLAAEARLAKQFVNIHAVHSGNSATTSGYVLASLSVAEEKEFQLKAV